MICQRKIVFLKCKQCFKISVSEEPTKSRQTSHKTMRKRITNLHHAKLYLGHCQLHEANIRWLTTLNPSQMPEEVMFTPEPNKFSRNLARRAHMHWPVVSCCIKVLEYSIINPYKIEANLTLMTYCQLSSSVRPNVSAKLEVENVPSKFANPQSIPWTH